VKGLLGTEQRSTKADVAARPQSERIPGGVTGRQHVAQQLGLETRQVLDVDSDACYVVRARDRRGAICIGVGDRADEAVWPSWRGVRVCRQRSIRFAESWKAATGEVPATCEFPPALLDGIGDIGSLLRPEVCLPICNHSFCNRDIGRQKVCNHFVSTVQRTVPAAFAFCGRVLSWLMGSFGAVPFAMR